MTRYLISFEDGGMTFPEEELPDEAEAAHEVVRKPLLAQWSDSRASTDADRRGDPIGHDGNGEVRRDG